ncbi:TfoX/Sxy family protein [Pseudorhodoplanes sp.]|uniref:TfoX/Sxy family protein n=1 Tax=Pseudorhodoplanes sp. TaxID=1934341 RepID=UPI00391DF9D3
MDPDHLRDLFANFRPVTVRRMFGGAGIYADGVMFALLSSGGTIYLRVDDGNEQDFVRENLPSFAPLMKSGKHAVMPYRQMPDRLYDDPEELAQWAQRALAAAQRKAVTKAKVKSERQPVRRRRPQARR